MEIDLTREVSEPHHGAPHDRYRHRIIVAAALVIGLAAGGLVGVAFGNRNTDDGAVVFTDGDLVKVANVVTLRWSLTNFSSATARVESVRVNQTAIAYEAPDIDGESIANFTTPLRCKDVHAPQFAIVVTKGDGERQEFGYLVARSDWERVCS